MSARPEPPSGSILTPRVAEILRALASVDAANGQQLSEANAQLSEAIDAPRNSVSRLLNLRG
jgi:hypothetical protein